MDKQLILNKTADYVRTKMEGEGSGHDWWHIYRVWQTTKTIAAAENADSFIAELGALLHDIADYKFHNGDELIGGKVTRQWLESLEVDSETIDAVVHIVDNVSFKGNAGKTHMQSLEGKVAQDADRLDGIGAIGIARCFAYGGHKGFEIYNPEVQPHLNMTKEEYKNHVGTSINHFYEKLLLIRDLMNTDTGRKLADGRHLYMLGFLDQFFAEVEGKR